MSEPSRFLTSFAQALATMTLYAEGHPARARAIDAAYEHLRELQQDTPQLRFSFLGHEVIFGQQALRDMKEWDWAARLANAGIQRMEFANEVTREEYESFLEEVLARLTLSSIDTAEARAASPTSIKYGAVGIRGFRGEVAKVEPLPTATIEISSSLGEEAEAVCWLHEEVQQRGELPLLEAEAVVRSLSLAMHGDQQVIIPLLQLKEFDQYTTTHSLNVAVLSMALGEFLGYGPRDVRAFGVAGLLHDLGKVRIPKEILNKPGKLTEEERAVMQQHPADGARIILASEKQLDLAAAVAYEHHIMLNGLGYPDMRFRRQCHFASKLVHVCDVYDALRTKRPYRDAWESERALAYLEERAGVEFDPDIVQGFTQMMRQWDKRIVALEEARAAGQDTGDGAGEQRAGTGGTDGAGDGSGPGDGAKG